MSESAIKRGTSPAINSWLMQPRDRCQPDSTTVSLFEEVAQHFPDRIAVTFESRDLTYQELNGLAEVLAQQLLAFSLQKETRVGICADRSDTAIAAMLACMKIGLAFVPLDPTMPEARLEYILEDAGVAHIFVSSEHQRLFASSDTFILHDLDSIEISTAMQIVRHPGRTAAPDTLAYIMYTSGSTGLPKGVEVEHGSLLTYVLADAEVFQVHPDDSCLQFTSLCFDLMIEEIFPQLICGARVVVRPRKIRPDSIELSSLIEQYQISIVHIATAYWHEWIDLMRALDERVPCCLRLLVATGEKVSPVHYQRWRELVSKDVVWANAYGPTEATVSATVFFPDESFAADSMPIGTTLPGYQAFILDENLIPVANGKEGELYLAGRALARGYHNRPDLTSKAFLSGPCLAHLPCDRLYKTGDRVVELANGCIDFIGRADSQIKLGSYRIEPGEIEAQILKYDAVNEALVTAHRSGTHTILVAFVSSTDSSVSPQFLRAGLEASLPAYMIPARIVVMPSFPKTINGKIDRRALAHQLKAEVNSGKQISGKDLQNEIEQCLATYWQEILGSSNPSATDDFFDCGGTSILAMRLIVLVSQEFKLRLTIEDLLRNSSIRKLATFIALKQEEATEDVTVGSYQHSEAFFFGPTDKQLYAVYHPPVEKQTARGAVLICAPLGQEYDRSHWSIRSLALQLAQNGYHVLRFDYRGTGDSSGNFSDVTVTSLLDDGELAYQKLLQLSGFDNASIVGLRFGATIAAELSCSVRASGSASLVLWDAFEDGAAYANELRDIARSNPKGQTFNKIEESGSLHVNGYRFNNVFLETLDTFSAPVFSIEDEAILSLRSHSGNVHQRPGAVYCSPGAQQDSEFNVQWNCLEPDSGALFLLQPFIYETLRHLSEGV